MDGLRLYDGCYDTKRAAALSGVPRSTVYYWARTGVIVPSISPSREMLWSYADLMGIRVIDWLRHGKGALGAGVPPSSMPEVRRALEQLEEQGIRLWDDNRSASSALVVDRSGHVYLREDDGAVTPEGQRTLFDHDLLAPLESYGRTGPNLRRPKPHLRIVPGKCSGEPHLDGSRVTTLAVAALARRGYALDTIARLYPDQDSSAIAEAVDLEAELDPSYLEVA